MEHVLVRFIRYRQCLMIAELIHIVDYLAIGLFLRFIAAILNLNRLSLATKNRLQHRYFSACIVMNPTMVVSYAVIFNCTTKSSNLRLNTAPSSICFCWLPPDYQCLCQPHHDPVVVLCVLASNRYWALSFPSIFRTDNSKAVPQLQFLIRASVVSLVTFVLSLFVLHFFLHFGALGSQNFIIVAFPGYLHLCCFLV